MRGVLTTGNLVSVHANRPIDTDRFAVGHAERCLVICANRPRLVAIRQGQLYRFSSVF